VVVQLVEMLELGMVLWALYDSAAPHVLSSSVEGGEGLTQAALDSDSVAEEAGAVMLELETCGGTVG
jgi:hypothetical protein